MKDTAFRKSSRKDSSRRWLARRRRDIYGTAAGAKGSHYRSRAAHKLIQIDDKARLIRSGAYIVDLGAAPGGWSQVALERAGRGGLVVAVDRAVMEPLSGAVILRLDVSDAPETAARITERLGRRADLVLSDMAAVFSGHRATDRLRAEEASLMAFALALDIVRVGGDILIKAFQGADAELWDQTRERFSRATREKPLASRRESGELYILGRGFKGESAA